MSAAELHHLEALLPVFGILGGIGEEGLARASVGGAVSRVLSFSLACSCTWHSAIGQNR